MINFRIIHADDDRTEGQPTFKMQRRTRRFGGGCLVQIIGLILWGVGAVVFDIVGLIAGFVVAVGFIVLGAAMAAYFSCGRCGNPVADKDVRMCPTCGALLKPPGLFG